MIVGYAHLEVRTPRAVKRIKSLVRRYIPFLLKIEGELRYVTRSGWVWGLDDLGNYTIPKGHIRHYVPEVPKWFKGDA